MFPAEIERSHPVYINYFFVSLIELGDLFQSPLTERGNYALFFAASPKSPIEGRNTAKNSEHDLCF